MEVLTCSCQFPSMARTKLTRPPGPWKLTSLLFCILSPIIQAHPLLSLNISLSSEITPQCTNLNIWTNGGSFNPDHCLQALYKIEDTDYKFYQTRDIEFLAQGAKRRTNLNAVRLPRRYTFDSCTIIVAMLSTITEHILPGQVRQADEYGSTDVSRFSYLLSIASWVDGLCVSQQESFGWCATGKHKDIGVFVVGTESRVYRIISRSLLVSNINRGASIGT